MNEVPWQVTDSCPPLGASPSSSMGLEPCPQQKIPKSLLFAWLLPSQAQARSILLPNMEGPRTSLPDLGKPVSPGELADRPLNKCSI